MVDKGYFLKMLIGQITSAVVVVAVLWTRVSVLESQIQEKWTYAMDERNSVKSELASLRMEMKAMGVQVNALENQWRAWQAFSEQQRIRAQQRQSNPEPGKCGPS